MKSDGLDDLIKQKIINLLRALFPEVKIYLYGSRAKGTYHDRSDIDLAVDAGKKLQQSQMSEAKSVLDGLRMPYKIDFVDMNAISAEFKETILQEGVLWQP